jgi:glycosyltransferase involved in cell wall biosynthesis
MYKETMQLTILVEGWVKYPHSYALVNVYQLLALHKKQGVKLLFKEKPPYQESWPVLDDLTGIILTEEESRTLSSIKRWNGKERVDIVYRISFPFDISSTTAEFSSLHNAPKNINPLFTIPKPVLVFYTAEFQTFKDSYFHGGSAKDFIERCHERKVIPVTPSTWSAQALIREKYEPLIIHHGVDIEKYRPLCLDEDVFDRDAFRDEKLGIPKNAFAFLNVGAMTGNKNIIAIIKAWYRLSILNDNVYLILKGIGDLYSCQKNINDCVKLLKQHGVIDKKQLCKLINRIIYIDELYTYSDMCKLYNAVDCYVSPYLAEGFNMPVLEAAACGLPLIVSKGGSTDDFTNEKFAKYPISLVHTEKTGERMILVDDMSLENTMLELVNDEEFCRQARKHGPAFVRDNFTWDKVTDKLLYFLEYILPDPSKNKIDMYRLPLLCRP